VWIGLWIELNVRIRSSKTSDDCFEKLVIGTIYRHPSSQYRQFCENLCSSIELLNRTNTKYVLLGDTNIFLSCFDDFFKSFNLFSPLYLYLFIAYVNVKYTWILEYLPKVQVSPQCTWSDLKHTRRKINVSN